MKNEYYLFDSGEEIKILHSVFGRTYHRIVSRPLMVAGMKRHTAEQLEKLRSIELWTVDELRAVEGW